MKRTIHDKEIAIAGRTLPINTTKGSGCHLEVLHATHDQMRAMLSYHCRLLVVGFDLHLYDDTPDNMVMTRLMDKLKKRIRQRYKSTTAMREIGHLWVREQNAADAPHFHVAMFLDAKHVKTAHPIHELVTSIWEGWGHPRPHRANNRTFIIPRDDEGEFGRAFRALSYFAKEATKGKRPPATNDYSTSRLKPKPMGEDVQGPKGLSDGPAAGAELPSRNRDCLPAVTLPDQRTVEWPTVAHQMPATQEMTSFANT